MVSAPSDGRRRALRRVLGKRSTVLLAVVGWFAAVAVIVVATTPASSTVAVLVGQGVVIGFGLQLYRRLEWRARESTRRVDALDERLDQVEADLTGIGRRVVDTGKQQKQTAQAIDKLARHTHEDTESIIQQVSISVRDAFYQLEALQNLHAMVPAHGRVPRSRDWAASPDLLLLLVDLVRRAKPTVVLECGSGVSTVWMALAMQHYGLDGQIIALDHKKTFADKTTGWLAELEVSQFAEVRLAPLEEHEIDGVPWHWYSQDAWSDVKDIDLLFVDGPPGGKTKQARFPALPLLHGRLGEDPIVVLDDTDRPDEKGIVELWLDAMPEFGSERIKLEKGAMILRPTSTEPTP